MLMKHFTWLPAVPATLLLLCATEILAQPTFINKIPIPPLIDAADGTIELEMRVTAHKFNPGNPSDSLNGGAEQPNGITTYTYNIAGDSTMTLLGPTLKWHTYENTVITVKNLLGAPTTTHWHGAEVPSMMDGGPHQGISPGETWNVNFPVLDSASTMWYHPHYHNSTVQQVQKGLSGMIIVEREDDPLRTVLPHTYGVDDIPVILGDVGFTGTSSPSTSMIIDSIKGVRPYNLVNGVTNPYIEVPAHVIRLRILNGSTRKGIFFGVSDSYEDPFSNLKEFYLIASDGGYMINPVAMTTQLNGPGERDEILIDLSGYEPGDIVYLSNLKDSIPNFVIGSPQKAPNGGGQDTTMGNAFLQLRIVSDDQFPGYTPVTSFTPFTTTWSPGLSDTSDIARHRLKRLVNMGAGKGFTIDSTTFEMMMINDTVCVDTKEIWAIRNVSDIAHPFHIHKIQFRVLDVTDSTGAQLDLATLGMNGPKDDVLVYPGWTLRFLGQFDDYPSSIEPMNSYMYHCHILMHEDSVGGGMMHQFVVTDEGECVSTSVAETGSDSPAMILLSSEGRLILRGSSAYPGTFAIFDVGGRRMSNQLLPAFDGDLEISTVGLPGGAYLVEWRAAEGVSTGKVILGN